MEDFAVSVMPGPGVIARWEAGIAVAGGPANVGPTLIAELQQELGDQPTSGRLIELLRADARFSRATIDLAVAVSTPEGVRVFIRGEMQARTETDELIAGPAPIERDLPDASAIWIGCTDPPAVQGHPAMDLRRGVVPGAGAVVYRTASSSGGHSSGAQAVVDSTGDHRLPTPAEELIQPPQPPASPSAPSAPPSAPLTSGSTDGDVPVRPFQAVDFTEAAAVETRNPLEILDEDDIGNTADDSLEIPSDQQVLGINCSRGHFNNPKAGYCQVCGISMVHLTHRLEPGPRPTLGFMVFADGATYALDRPYLVGRSPQPAPGSGFTALATQDATQSVSREHARIEFDGWDVVYVDLGSTNGSFLWDVTVGRWQPIAPHTPVVLQSASTVSVGRMTFVFEGASRAVDAR